MYDICKKCGKIVEEVQQHREYRLTNEKIGLFRHGTFLYCEVKCPLCGQTYGRKYIIKKKSKHSFYATNCELYWIVHSDKPEAADKEVFYKDVKWL